METKIQNKKEDVKRIEDELQDLVFATQKSGDYGTYQRALRMLNIVRMKRLQEEVNEL